MDIVAGALVLFVLACAFVVMRMVIGCVSNVFCCGCLFGRGGSGLGCVGGVIWMPGIIAVALSLHFQSVLDTAIPHFPANRYPYVAAVATGVVMEDVYALVNHVRTESVDAMGLNGTIDEQVNMLDYLSKSLKSLQPGEVEAWANAMSERLEQKADAQKEQRVGELFDGMSFVGSWANALRLLNRMAHAATKPLWWWLSVENRTIDILKVRFGADEYTDDQRALKTQLDQLRKELEDIKLSRSKSASTSGGFSLGGLMGSGRAANEEQN